ncbi:MAG TPA: AarF/UbiB family protein [Solirubrobacteraceae bacterium]
MDVLVVPAVVVGVACTIWLYAFGVRRLLGLSLSIPRALLAGVVALAAGSPIITAVASSAKERHQHALPGVWFVILGAAIALLVGMFVLVLIEALVPSGRLPGPLYVLRSLRKRGRRIRRYGQISRILARRGMLPYLSGSRRAELATPDGRSALARALRLALEDGGVTFVKLGQVLATRRDLLPPEFISELSGLQDDAAPVPWSEIEAVLHRELPGGVDEVFASFERQPLAAASIAQVHAATLSGGEQLVVKVRRPRIDTIVDWDLDIVGRLAARLGRSTAWGRGVGIVDLANGFARALREELDLRVEVRNMVSVEAATAASARETNVCVPRAHRDLCTSKVLVMERLEGRSLASIGPTEDVGNRAALARALFECLLQQVMVDGIFHADPHPGNVLLLSDTQLALLDFGSVGRLDSALRAALQRLLLAVDRGDAAWLCDTLLDIARRPDELDERALERGLGQLLARHVVPGLTPDVRMFTDLVRILADHGLSVPPDVAGAFRALATIEGTLTGLAPGFDVIAEARAFATRYLAGQLNPTAMRASASAELPALLSMLRRVPRRLDRVTGSLEEGRLSVNVRLLADERDRRYITSIAHQLILTFLAATTGIMATLMLGLHGGPSVTHTVSLYAFFGYCLLVFAGVLALRVLVLVFRLGST